jgi:hypothetical protein
VREKKGVGLAAISLISPCPKIVVGMKYLAQKVYLDGTENCKWPDRCVE